MAKSKYDSMSPAELEDMLTNGTASQKKAAQARLTNNPATPEPEVVKATVARGRTEEQKYSY